MHNPITKILRPEDVAKIRQRSSMAADVDSHLKFVTTDHGEWLYDTVRNIYTLNDVLHLYRQIHEQVNMYNPNSEFIIEEHIHHPNARGTMTRVEKRTFGPYDSLDAAMTAYIVLFC